MYQIDTRKKDMKLNKRQAVYFVTAMTVTTLLNSREVDENGETEFYLKNSLNQISFLSSEQKALLKNTKSKKTLSLKNAKTIKEAFNTIRKVLEKTKLTDENLSIKTIKSYEENDKIPEAGLKDKSFEAIFNKNFSSYVKPVFNVLPYREREKTAVSESTKL